MVQAKKKAAAPKTAVNASDAGALRPAAPLPLDELADADAEAAEAEADAAEAADASEEEADAATPDADETIEATADEALAPEADAEADAEEPAAAAEDAEAAVKDVCAALAEDASDDSASAPVKTGAVAVIVVAPDTVLALTEGVAV